MRSIDLLRASVVLALVLEGCAPPSEKTEASSSSWDTSTGASASSGTTTGASASSGTSTGPASASSSASSSSAQSTSATTAGAGGATAGAGGAGGAGGDGSGGNVDPPAPEGFPSGTELTTTDALNLRAGPGTDQAILTVMPPDSGVVVVDDASTKEWAHVKYLYGGDVGWAHTDYLATPPPPVHPDYDRWRGEVLAKTAQSLWDGSASGDMCLYGVDQSCKGSGAVPHSENWPTLPSAVDWGDWAVAHPGEMHDFGFLQMDLPPDGVPLGSIIVWQPGQCGYHSLYGHIEIVVDNASSRACSDFCGSVRHDCGHPWTWIPIEVP